jgi:hypothetical protein
MKKQEGCAWQMREKRIKSNIKYFRKKEVDLGKFVNHYYIENGLAYISCNVKGIFDIVNPYSVENYEVINSGFADFIEENAYYIPVEYPIVLEICGTNFTAGQQEMIKRIVTDYYALRLGDKQIDLKINRNKTIFLFVMGILFFGIFWFLNAINVTDAIIDFSSLIFWFFIWEFGDLVWYERRKLISDKTEAGQLASMKVVFKEKFVDTPLSPQASEKIIEEIFEEGD